MIGHSGQDEEAKDEQVNVRTSKGSRAVAGGGGGAAAPERARKSTNLQAILAEPGQTNRILSLLEYYADLDPSEFEAEMQKLQGLPMSQRMLAMNLLFARWAETDPQASLEASRKIGFPEMFMARAGVLQGWAASDPEGLAKQYTDNPSDFRMGGPGGRGGGETVRVIAGEWAKQNPEAALRWARTLDEREAGDAIAGIFQEVSQQDPKLAASMAAGLSDTERTDAYRSIAETWAVSDYAAADKWINTLSGDEQVAARSEAVEALAGIDPQRAAGEALKLPDGEQRDELIADVSRDWAREDPGAALTWLTANGGDGAIEEGIGRVMGSLASEEPAKAMEWIEAQPAGDVRDSAVQGYVFGNRDAAPSETIAIAETISNEETRERTVSRVAFQWMREDSDAALNYVQSSTALSDETKERVSGMAERMAEGGGGDRPFGRGGPGGGPRGGR